MTKTSNARNAVVGATILAATLATQQTVSLAQQPPAKVAEPPLIVEPAYNADEEVVVDGLTFKSWAEYFASEHFAKNGKRCGFMPGPFAYLPDEGGIAGGTSGHCSTNNTFPTGAPIYSPTAIKFRIPMVVHSITNGVVGNLSDTQIRASVAVLNEDFMTLTGTPGANGNNAQIEFFLTNDFATALGGGTTTGNGIMRYNNATWYNDGGAYYNSIARFPSQYFNLYTNSAGGGGVIGYTPSNNAVGGCCIGSNSDRVVVLWSVMGDPCPVGGPYCSGRTATHEVGHYLGLYHPWEFGCDTGSCNATGDRVCDTNQINSPTGGCPASKSTCGDGADNFRNYMDYTNDTCMTNFTVNQTNRMRCVLDNWRTGLPIRINIFSGDFTGTPNTLTPNVTAPGTTINDLADTQPGLTDGAGNTAASYTGIGLAFTGDEVGYRINHPGGDLKLTLSGVTSDLDLHLLGAAGTPASRIASSTLDGTTPDVIDMPGLAAGTYYAVVETFAVSSHSVYGSNYSLLYEQEPVNECPSDIDSSNAVDVNDLLAVITSWGACSVPCPPTCSTDISPVGTGNCATDVNDLLAIITTWGPCP